ncbi:MAG: hypothetical protein J7L15_08510, partial [Clostridiales bacterium]|nr:hypothetical protein [Clostridiales bacterium]
MQIDMKNLAEKLKQVDEMIKTTKKYSAIVEKIGNKDKPGQVKIRVAGVHTPSKSKLPTDDLPWQKAENETGAGGGIGESINLAVGQWVEVEAEHIGQSSWRILKNIPAVGQETTDTENAYGNVAEGYQKEWLTQDIIPRIGSTIASLLATTSFSLINSACCTATSPCAGGAAGAPACSGTVAGAPPQLDKSRPFDIVCGPVGWCRDMAKVIDKDGKDLGAFKYAIKIN